jgi:sugar (pentulose or hexulose) kinase
MSGLPLLMPEVEETAGLGVALVAGLATGLFASEAEAAALPLISWQRLDPDPVLAEQYLPLTAPMLERLEEGAAAHG